MKYVFYLVWANVHFQTDFWKFFCFFFKFKCVKMKKMFFYNTILTAEKIKIYGINALVLW